MMLSALSGSAQTNTSTLTNATGLISEGQSLATDTQKAAGVAVQNSSVTVTEKTLSIEERTEKIRAVCITGRRYVCGKVVQIVPEGLVVDSGYSVLLTPPFNQSWVVPGNATVARDAHPLEFNSTDAVCMGLVFIMDIPKKPAVKENDYVVLHAYPAGQYTYTPVATAPQLQKVIRKFAAGLDTAVKVKLQAGEK
ncbi:MAG: hypothetical protein JWR26_1611 [Pedosphaera sp.]|nr:hypothetical protein [Pedosphaera sp.]